MQQLSCETRDHLHLNHPNPSLQNYFPCNKFQIPSKSSNKSKMSSSPPPPPLYATGATSSDSSSAILILTIVAFSVIALACVYLLLRHLHRYHRTFPESSSSSASQQTSTARPPRQVSAAAPNNSTPPLQNLPIFEFRSVKGNLTGGDCAVCLSKFELPDQLRLLPLCCHAFHVECIDAWILSNGTCPLCRSPVFTSEQHLFDKMPPPAPNRGIITDTNNHHHHHRNNSNSHSSNNNSRSFRIEIGNISRREGGGATARPGEPAMARSLSYSLGGAFDYVVSENGYEVSIGELSDFVSLADKDFALIGVHVPEPPGEVLAAEVVESGRSWLRDYVDRLASVSFSSSSFRSSGRFFSGSSRRTDSIVTVEDLETGRAGEEISELFRWLSGV